MRSVWQQCRKFLTAEEVPRWFGLSLVLIYLVGLGSVAQFAIEHARHEGSLQFHQVSRYAAEALAERIARVISNSDSEPLPSSAIQRTFRHFESSLPTRWIRVVDARRNILASTNKSDVGTQAPVGPIYAAIPVTTETIPIANPQQPSPDALLRVRIPTFVSRSGARDVPAALRTNDPATSSAGLGVYQSLCLELRLPSEPIASPGGVNHARMLAIVLIVLGALFVVYRCLREQLQGVSRIANRLQTHAHRIADDLDALHVDGAADDVASAWNELIDVTKELRQAQRQSQADDELSHALKNVSGGALATALNAIPDAFLFIRNDERVQFANTTARRLFAIPPADDAQIALSDVEASGVADKILAVIRKSCRASDSFDACNHIVDADDSEGEDGGTYRVRVFPLKRRESDGEHVVLVSDVSQQMRADRAREELMAQVTHELRTPLTNIRAYAETLSSGMFDDPKVITDCYNVITKETRRLTRLIEDMLSASQLEVGTVQLSVGPVDLKALISDAVQDVRGLADDKNIDLQLVLPAKLELLEGDRDKLAVVLNNLLGNAIKYTPSDGNVVVGCQCGADEVVLTIKDNGLGIDVADQARIFEKFQRSKDADVQNEPGNGLGLFTAREIVRQHQGRLEVISKKGEGSTFLARLPRNKSSAATANTREEV